MTTIDLGGIKVRFCRSYVHVTEQGPLDVDWTLMIGLATPSIRFFPMAWNLLAVDKRRGCRRTIDFFRMKVVDG